MGLAPNLPGDCQDSISPVRLSTHSVSPRDCNKVVFNKTSSSLTRYPHDGTQSQHPSLIPFRVPSELRLDSNRGEATKLFDTLLRTSMANYTRFELKHKPPLPY